MAKRPPPEPIDHHYDIARLTKVFAITCLISIPTLAWMTWQDYGRDWKHWQKEVIRYDRLRTKAALAELARLEKTKTDAEEALKKIDEEYDRYQAKLKTLHQNDAFYFVRNAPIADMLAPNLKVQQVQLDGLFNDVNFLKSQRVDR